MVRNYCCLSGIINCPSKAIISKRYLRFFFEISVEKAKVEEGIPIGVEANRRHEAERRAHVLSASGSRLEREPRTLPRWYRALPAYKVQKTDPTSFHVCVCERNREEEKRKSELCFRFDLRDDDHATILILDKYPFQPLRQRVIFPSFDI